MTEYDNHDDQDDQYSEFKHKANQQRTEKDVRYKDNSKRRLLNILKKKFDTTIIGSLAAFEESFGDLWGHGLPTQALDEDQLYWWYQTFS